MKIETEADYESAIDLIELSFQHVEYWQARLDYWSRAVEEYEDIHYPIEKPSLWTRIKFRLAMKYKWMNWLLGITVNTVVKTVAVLVLVSIYLFILSYMFGEINKELFMQIIWFIAKIVLTIFVTLVVLFHFDKTRR